jgi:hypothetical protein
MPLGGSITADTRSRFSTYEYRCENSVMKLSEKSWRCPNRGLTRVRMGTFRHQTPAKPALGDLLKPLFRQFQGEVRLSPGPSVQEAPKGIKALVFV